MPMYVVVHKDITVDPNPAPRTTKVVASSADAASAAIQRKYPGHQILQTEMAGQEIYFEEDPGALDEEPEPMEIRTAKAALLDRHFEKPPLIPWTGTPRESGRWAEKWAPSYSEDEQPNLKTIVGQAIGAASMCWQNEQGGAQRPEGIFDSEQAEWIFGGAVDAIERLAGFIEAKDPETVNELVEQFSSGNYGLTEIVVRAFNAGYQAHMDDRSGKPKDPEEGPQAPSRHDQEIEDLCAEIARRDDKIYLMERLIEAQPPFGTDLANFKRRLMLLVQA